MNDWKMKKEKRREKKRKEKKRLGAPDHQATTHTPHLPSRIGMKGFLLDRGKLPVLCFSRFIYFLPTNGDVS